MRQKSAPLPKKRLQIGFIGTGMMGAPMAKNILKQGFSVAVYDRAPGLLAQFAKQRNCRIAKSPADAAENADVLICMLPNSRITRAVLFGREGAAKALKRGAMVLEMGTGELSDLLNSAEKLRALGVCTMDAPVGRSRREAVSGKLLVMAGGDKKTAAPFLPLLSAMGSDIVCAGSLGAGLKLKMVNNYMSLVNYLTAAEGLVFAEVLGLPQKETLEVLQNTPAGCGHLSGNYPRKALRGDISPDFAMALGLKDMTLALRLAARTGAPLALGRTAKKRMQQAEEFGHLQDDCTAMLKVVEKLAKQTRRAAAKKRQIAVKIPKRGVGG